MAARHLAFEKSITLKVEVLQFFQERFESNGRHFHYLKRTGKKTIIRFRTIIVY